MRRRLLELGLFSLPPILALASAPFLARGLGPEGRGQVATVLAVYSVGVTLGSFGQSEAYAADLLQTRFGQLRTRVWISAVLSVVAAAATAFALGAMNIGLATCLVAVALIPLDAVSRLWAARGVSYGQTTVLGAAVGTTALLRAGFVALLFVGSGLTTFSVVGTTQLGFAVGFVIVGLAVWRHGARERRGSPRPPEARATLGALAAGAAQGLPILGFELCYAVVLRADLVALNIFSTPVEVGYYAAVVAVAEASYALSTAFKNRVQVACYSDHPRAAVARELRIMVAIALAALVVGEIVAGPFVTIFFGDEFRPAVPAFRILMIAAVAHTMYECGQGILMIQGRRGAMFKSSAIGAALTLALLPVAVPLFNAAGAAAASLVVYIAVSVIAVSMAMRGLATQPRHRRGPGERIPAFAEVDAATGSDGSA